MFDKVINNGHIIDPINKISSKLNLGIAKGKIVSISNEPLSGATEINAEKMIVSPGFVDIHMHEDKYNTEDDSFSICISNAMLKMGVTTAIGGNCGISTGCKDPIRYLDAVDKSGFPINMAMLSLNQALRESVGIIDVYQKSDEASIKRMGEILREQLQKGCIGLSMGIEYMPGVDSDEMKGLMEVASQFESITAIHMRNDAEISIPSIFEMIHAAESKNAALQISHIGSMCSFGQMERALAIVDAYRIKGLDVGFDCYPYYAYCTNIGSACFDDGFIDSYGLLDDGYSKLEIASGKQAGMRCTKESFMDLRSTEPETLIIGHVLNENEVDKALAHPICIIASDGIFSNGQGHPRGSGTFPRFIHEYVKNKKMLTLEGALEKITYLPAKRFGLNKGTLSVGADADITIFDFNKIKDRSSFNKPLEAPDGIECVLIQGEMALRQSMIVNDTLGRAVRKIR